MKRVFNFSAGPAILPEEVLKQALEEMFDYNGTGMSVMEMSHRSKPFEKILDDAINDLKAKGLMIDEAEVNKILAKRRQLVKLNKQLESKDDPYSVSGKSLQDKIQQKLNPFNYEYKKRLEEQKAKKGEALTKKQRSQIRKVVELQFKANDLMNMKPAMDGLQTFTNELASRGGFSSSVVSASKNDVNERIYKVQKQSQIQLRNILAEMKRMGVIG